MTIANLGDLMFSDSEQILREIHAYQGKVNDVNKGTASQEEGRLAINEIEKLTKLLNVRQSVSGKEI